MNDDDVWNDYERALRSLLWRVKQRHLQAAVGRLLRHARRPVDQRALSSTESLSQVYTAARQRIVRRLLNTPLLASAGRRRAALLDLCIPQARIAGGPDFHCDAALGGLARWLRAAGYDATFWPDIDDDELLRKMPGSTAILLTTDEPLMERGVICSGAIAAALVSIRLKKREQFSELMARLQLPRRPPRCMGCGGQLLQVDKQTVKDRIPPRTFPWLDDYYLCQRCDRLFWKGTHWQRIQDVLEKTSSER